MKKELDRTTLIKARNGALHKILNSSPKPGEHPDEHVTRCWWEAFCDAIEGQENLVKHKEYFKVKDK